MSEQGVAFTNDPFASASLFTLDYRRLVEVLDACKAAAVPQISIATSTR